MDCWWRWAIVLVNLRRKVFYQAVWMVTSEWSPISNKPPSHSLCNPPAVLLPPFAGTVMSTVVTGRSCSGTCSLLPDALSTSPPLLDLLLSVENASSSSFSTKQNSTSDDDGCTSGSWSRKWVPRVSSAGGAMWKRSNGKKQKKSHRPNQITLPKLFFSALNEVFPSYARELGLQEASVPLEYSETSPATSFMWPPTVGIVKFASEIFGSLFLAQQHVLLHTSLTWSLSSSVSNTRKRGLSHKISHSRIPGNRDPHKSHKEKNGSSKKQDKKPTARLLHQMLSQEKNNHLKARTQQQQHQETSREETRRKNQQMLSQANKIKISLCVKVTTTRRASREETRRKKKTVQKWMRNTTKTSATNENGKLESKNSSCKFYSFKCLEAKQKNFEKKKYPLWLKTRRRMKIRRRREDEELYYTCTVFYKGNRRFIRKHYVVDTNIRIILSK